LGTNQDNAKNALLQQGFGDKEVYPFIALFLVTGNQTANVACAILERLFDDPNTKLWDYDPDTLLPNLPTMITFPKLNQFYKDWAADLHSKGSKRPAQCRCYRGQQKQNWCHLPDQAIRS
jgi:hypothetical protein